MWQFGMGKLCMSCFFWGGKSSSHFGVDGLWVADLFAALAACVCVVHVGLALFFACWIDANLSACCGHYRSVVCFDCMCDQVSNGRWLESCVPFLVIAEFEELLR